MLKLPQRVPRVNLEYLGEERLCILCFYPAKNAHVVDVSSGYE